MAKRTKSRLGKGLSGMISTPVPIAPNAGAADEADATPRPPVVTNKATPATSQASDASPDSRPTISGGGKEADGRVMRMVAIGDIEPNQYQPRRVFDNTALDQLASSIRQSGVIQPIAVRRGQRDNSAAWELIAGERRWRAAKRAGLDTIPAVIVELSERESAEWALVENLQREDLDPMERADALKALSETFGLTHQQIAEQVGLDRATVSNLIRITDLEPEIRMLVTARGEEKLSAGHARALLAVDGKDARLRLARQAARESWSVRALEREIAGPSDLSGSNLEASNVGNSPQTPTKQSDPQHAYIERRLGEALGTRVRLDTKNDDKGGRISFEYYSNDHFSDLMDRLGLKLED